MKNLKRHTAKKNSNAFFIIFPDKKQYYSNKKNYKFYGIDDKLLFYKDPTKAFGCESGWTLSSKYNKERIGKHNEICPVNSLYGIVPAYKPVNIENDEECLLEFHGYKQRLNKNKCIFDLRNRKIEFTGRDSIGEADVTATITRDLGNGFIEIKPINNKLYVVEFKKLHYHNTPGIWRG